MKIIDSGYATLLKMTHFNFWILAFFTIFFSIKTNLSGNTVWQQATGFQKLAKMYHFWLTYTMLC